ncbi:MAG: hypothetical protein GXO64_02055 [Candidatus Micrarchaeota archaeon]|nr:hypothetical protein [Candidatus Micrarchaeota archaeon]
MVGMKIININRQYRPGAISNVYIDKIKYLVSEGAIDRNEIPMGFVEDGRKIHLYLRNKNRIARYSWNARDIRDIQANGYREEAIDPKKEMRRILRRCGINAVKGLRFLDYLYSSLAGGATGYLISGAEYKYGLAGFAAGLLYNPIKTYVKSKMKAKEEAMFLRS